ncbi:hypothetical protein [methane-oxidizing endosymbiont of Gigantopelta aegis]|uniref:hypothetical protein n=1 Tax=methane-oxidizing endosymbiont of Gigantopelta aegis TaxID=2794938 RepID=UPI0018DBFDA8|nr:hypothetical protein [methane-oxidizing endosymbiont of Gigantopelta aegis]
MEEVIFYHKPSKTLIVADWVENFDPATLNWWYRVLAKLVGILYPNGKMPLDWRLSFLLGNKNEAKKHLKKILAWRPENLILSHGKCIFGNAHKFIEKSFLWLEVNA